MGPNDALLACVESTRPSPYERHFHNAYELVYVCAGTARFQIGGACYEAAPRALFFISKLEQHSVTAMSAGYHRYYLQLTPAQLDRMLESPRLRAAFVSRPAGFCHRFDIGAAAERIEPLFHEMAREAAAPGALSRPYLTSLFNEAMILCFRSCPGQFPQPAGEVGTAVFDAQEYIDRNYTRPLTLAELSARFFMSPSYLSHAFRAWTGRSPKQYIMLSRIALARELLTTTMLPVADIAIRCGFSDVNNFIRSFKKETGAPPNRYRRGALE